MKSVITGLGLLLMTGVAYAAGCCAAAGMLRQLPVLLRER
jgi:hypothetical protein